MEEQLTKQQRREMKNQMRDAKRALEGRRGLLISILWWVFFILVIGGLVAYVIWSILRPLSGTKFPILERTHVEESEKPTYNSDPPTSGSHYGETEEWGIYDRPLVMEKLVHNLEHGGVLIFYNCKDCDELVGKLKEVAARLAKNDRKIVLAPYDKLDSKIAIVSWG